MSLTGEDSTNGDQVGIVAPDCSVAIVAVTTVLLPHGKTGSLGKGETEQFSERRELHVELR